MVTSYKNFDIEVFPKNENGSVDYQVHFGDAPVIERQTTITKNNEAIQMAEIKSAIEDIICTLPMALSFGLMNDDEDY